MPFSVCASRWIVPAQLSANQLWVRFIRTACKLQDRAIGVTSPFHSLTSRYPCVSDCAATEIQVFNLDFLHLAFLAIFLRVLCARCGECIWFWLCFVRLL